MGAVLSGRKAGVSAKTSPEPKGAFARLFAAVRMQVRRTRLMAPTLCE